MNENGKIKYVYWTLGIIFMIFIFIGNKMIDVDRVRASEDVRVEQNLRSDMLRIQTESQRMQLDGQKLLLDITQRLARIEGILEDGRR